MGKEAISALQSNGVSIGNGLGGFDPSGVLTRESYAQLLYRAMQIKKMFLLNNHHILI